jgi:hypothetical protein
MSLCVSGHQSFDKAHLFRSVKHRIPAIESPVSEGGGKTLRVMAHSTLLSPCIAESPAES